MHWVDAFGLPLNESLMRRCGIKTRREHVEPMPFVMLKHNLRTTHCALHLNRWWASTWRCSFSL
jgi:hypothetical protein